MMGPRKYSPVKLPGCTRCDEKMRGGTDTLGSAGEVGFNEVEDKAGMKSG
jgi:hypothetical protein